MCVRERESERERALHAHPLSLHTHTLSLYTHFLALSLRTHRCPDAIQEKKAERALVEEFFLFVIIQRCLDAIQKVDGGLLKILFLNYSFLNLFTALPGRNTKS